MGSLMAKTISERLKKLFDISGIRLYYFLAKSILFMSRSPLPVWFAQVYLIAVPIIYFNGVFFSFSRAAAGSRCFILLSRLETLTSTSTEGRGLGGGGALRLCELTELPGSAPRQVSESKQHICDSICNGACHKSLSVIPPLALIYLPPRLPGRANSCAATQNHPHSAGVNCKPMAGVKSPLANP